MYALMRGTLKTGERIVLKTGDKPFTEEADNLNQEHYEKCFIEYFGKSPTGQPTPNKKYIWFSKQIRGSVEKNVLD